MDLNLNGKVALVTGGAQGIGRAIALELAREGANIIIADINEKHFESAIKEIESLGRKAVTVLADVRKKTDAKRMVDIALETFSRLDILVNNAGLTRVVPSINLDENDWDLVVDTDLKGTFLCSQAAARVMVRQQHGCIVNISSMCGLRGWGERAAFGSAKAGVNNLTRILAAELGPEGIRVNCVAPGYVLTQALRELFEVGKLDKDMLLKGIPLRKISTPEDVAYAVVFLASEKASFLTGHVIVIDGGQTSSGAAWQTLPSKLQKMGKG
jgi:NAD(P)-dependent dehydrogenase (short-subunit alcohol dehydrogenase family)